MIEISSEELALHAQRRGVVAHTLYWIVARDRETGEPAPMGLWTGDDTQVFTVGGTPRTYYGPVVIESDPIRMVIGLQVDDLGLSLAHLAPEVETLIRGYDVRQAPVEIHALVAHLDTRAMVAPPRLVWSGRVDSLPITTPEAGGAGAARPILAPAQRALTRTYPWRRSHADQQEISPGDDFFLHASAAAQREVPVGERNVRAASSGSTLGVDNIGLGGDR